MVASDLCREAGFAGAESESMMDDMSIVSAWEQPSSSTKTRLPA